MELAIRDTIDDQYRVVEKHRGGMSIVYIVLDEFSQRRFAVKTLKEELLADRSAVTRFAQEARTWMNVGRHPNIVEAVIYREIDNCPMLFLEYVDGTDMQRLLAAEDRLFYPQLMEFALQVCAGMEYVHNLPIGPGGRGVIHRDLKPANLMLSRQCTVKVTDFGLAKMDGGAGGLTDSGIGLGTYLYMPPEQFIDAASADRSSDIYSMGVILYVAITGQQPLHGDNVGALIRNILNQEPGRPSQLVNNVPPALEEVIMPCLAKDRADRYQSFSELARALGDIETAVSDAAMGTTVVRCKQCGYTTRHGYSACPVCVGSVESVVFGPAPTAAQPPGLAGATDGTASPPTPAQQATTIAAADDLYERARQWLAEGELRRAIALLRQVLAINPDHVEARRGLDEAALALVKERSQKATRAYNWPMFRGNITRTGYTPEVVLPPLQRRWQTKIGEWVIASPVVANGVVFVGSGSHGGIGSGAICALSAKTGDKLWERRFNHDVLLSGCVLGGKVLLFAIHNRLLALEGQTGDVLWQVAVPSEITASPVAWQNIVYFGSDDGRVFALSAQSGQRVWEYKTEMGVHSSPLVWQGRVYVGSSDFRLHALNAGSGAPDWSFMTGGEILSSPAFHQGRVYVSSVDRRIYCIDADTGRRVWEFQTGGPVESSPAAWQSFVYVGSRDGRIYAVDAETGTHLWNFETKDWVNASPALSGRALYCGSHDGTLYALESHTGVCLWQYETGSQLQSSPAVSGRAVYTAGRDGVVYCFRPRSC